MAVATLQDGRLDVRQVLPTEAASADALMDEIAVVVEKLRRRETAAVGIGVPAVVEFATGRVKWCWSPGTSPSRASACCFR